MSGRENSPPLSIMERKFLMASRGFPVVVYPPDVFHKQLYFFYGTLMDPVSLAEVLSLPEPPTLKPAKVTRYHFLMWGPVPALVNDGIIQTVHGMAYEVQSRKEEELLGAYVTSRYTRLGCMVSLEDGTTVLGMTFGWRGKKDDLVEGTFSLQNWLTYKSENNLERRSVEDTLSLESWHIRLGRNIERAS